MKRNNKTSILFKIFLLLLFAGYLTGCQPGLYSKVGTTVKPEHRIVLLEKGPHSGSFLTKDISLQYNYVLHPERLELSGNLEITGIAGAHDYLAYFNLYANFLDSEGKILYKNRFFILHRSETRRGKFPFKRSIAVTMDAKAMAFSYSGSSKDSDGSDSYADYWNFWFSPVIH